MHIGLNRFIHHFPAGLKHNGHAPSELLIGVRKQISYIPNLSTFHESYPSYLNSHA